MMKNQRRLIAALCLLLTLPLHGYAERELLPQELHVRILHPKPPEPTPTWYLSWKRSPAFQGRRVESLVSTVVTVDGSLAAHYENTILITDGEPEILTIADDI